MVEEIDHRAREIGAEAHDEGEDRRNDGSLFDGGFVLDCVKLMYRLRHAPDPEGGQENEDNDV